jgi:hypothetical protein
MPQGGRDQRDWRALVDGMRCVGVAQPVDGCGRVDAGALGGLFDDEVTARSVNGLPGRRMDWNTGEWRLVHCSSICAITDKVSEVAERLSRTAFDPHLP